MDILRITEDSELCKRSIEAGNFEIEQLRICRFSKLIAGYVVNEKGEVDIPKAKEVIEKFQIQPYGSFDDVFPQHVKQIIEIFFQKKYALKLKQLSFPLANKWVEELIKISVGNHRDLEKRDIIVVLIEALFIFLRQAVGSCFATAPIIYMQTNDPEFLFLDLYELITRGQLRRVIDGIEYKVPISIKTSGKLDFESPILRCYEYTVASFADWKTEFYKWNMYTGLGLDTKDAYGIGSAVFNFLQEKLEVANKEIEKLQEELFHAEDRYKTTEALFRNVTSEDQARRLQAEAKMEAHHFYVSRDMMDEKRGNAENIAKFYPFFIEQLIRLFPLYFQEVFDPELTKGDGEILEDRPAGFRLMFKHGRSDPTVWTMIFDEKEYLKSLEEFFRLAEADIGYSADWKGAKDLIQEVIDRVIQTLWEKSFLQNAYLRIKEMHKTHVSEITSLQPWAYISGGSLESLVSCYFSLKNPLIKKEFFPESPLELCAFLIDYMKDLSYIEAKQFEDNPLKAILMTNQVHAFLFRPGLKTFLEAWQDRGNTYTYIRDHEGFIAFADTNWGSELFAFTHNPKTKKLQLYRKSTFELKPLPESWNAYFSKTSAWTLWKPQIS